METIEMVLIKSTKNTHVYGAEDEGVAITSVYIQKNNLPTPPPEEINITLSYEN